MPMKIRQISFAQSKSILEISKTNKIGAIKYARDICREPLTENQIEIEKITGVKQFGYSIGLREAKDAVEHLMHVNRICPFYPGAVQDHVDDLAMIFKVDPPIKALVITTAEGDVTVTLEEAADVLLRQNLKFDIRVFAEVFELFYLIEDWNTRNS